MKQIFVMFALLLGVCAANAQTTDTVKYAAGNDLYRGITRKLPYRQMVTPYGVEVTFAKTVHIIFPAAVRYVDLGSNHIIAGKADGAENVIRVKATTEGFPGETNFSVICEDGSFFSFNAKYAREPEMLNIEMKDFLENEDTSDFSHTRMNIYFRELGNESPLLVKLIMQSIYKNNDRKVRHLGSKRFGIQFLIKTRKREGQKPAKNGCPAHASGRGDSGAEVARTGGETPFRLRRRHSRSAMRK